LAFWEIARFPNSSTSAAAFGAEYPRNEAKVRKLLILVTSIF
jgi:hypothetical protein